MGWPNRTFHSGLQSSSRWNIQACKSHHPNIFHLSLPHPRFNSLSGLLKLRRVYRWSIQVRLSLSSLRPLTNRYCRWVQQELVQNLRPGSRSPFNICQDYQRLATLIAMNANGPPTTRVSDHGMTITFREHTLHIPAFREGLAKLAADIEEELDNLCYSDSLGMRVPPVVPDDWANESRGYSWTNNDPENFSLSNANPLFYRMLQDPDRMLVDIVNGNL